jgi:DNA-binding GntR family transcriptional regulator
VTGGTAAASAVASPVAQSQAVQGAAGQRVASARIADTLRAAILDGACLPGERIRQENLAARSGASRIPVREALRMLQAEGLVTLVANSGAWVTRLSLAECMEVYQIRERLEPLLLRTSLPGLGGPALARMAELADVMEQAGDDVDAFLRADREFHLSSYAAAPPGETAQIIGRLWNLTHHYRREFTRLTGQRDGLGATHLEHRLLLDCLRRADPDDAERMLVMHIRRTRLELSRHPEIFG